MTHFYRPFYSESHVQLPKVENTQSNSKKWKTYSILWSVCHGVSIVLSPSNKLGMHVQFTHTEKSSLIMAIITALLCSVSAEEIIFPWQITYYFSTSIYLRSAWALNGILHFSRIIKFNALKCTFWDLFTCIFLRTEYSINLDNCEIFSITLQNKMLFHWS